MRICPELFLAILSSPGFPTVEGDFTRKYPSKMHQSCEKLIPTLSVAARKLGLDLWVLTNNGMASESKFEILPNQRGAQGMVRLPSSYL
jgi:hypothetical protein